MGDKDLNETTEILIVDDHPIIRQGLAQILTLHHDGYRCSGAGNAREAQLAMQNDQPDLVILDISLEGTSGLNLISFFTAHYPDVPILVMSMHEESLYAERCLKLGARGYIMKQQAVASIQTAIRRILSGGIYLSDKLQTQILDRLTHQYDERLIADPATSLTNRELEILRLIAAGLGTREIAETLNRSVKTVEAHRANIKEKLGLKNATDLIRYATIWIKEND
ncbi:MAG: response regulator [Gammaproteobacteria bacterium]